MYIYCRWDVLPYFGNDIMYIVLFFYEHDVQYVSDITGIVSNVFTADLGIDFLPEHTLFPELHGRHSIKTLARIRIDNILAHEVCKYSPYNCIARKAQQNNCKLVKHYFGNQIWRILYSKFAFMRLFEHQLAMGVTRRG